MCGILVVHSMSPPNQPHKISCTVRHEFWVGVTKKSRTDISKTFSQNWTTQLRHHRVSKWKNPAWMFITKGCTKIHKEPTPRNAQVVRRLFVLTPPQFPVNLQYNPSWAHPAQLDTISCICSTTIGPQLYYSHSLFCGRRGRANTCLARTSECCIFFFFFSVTSRSQLRPIPCCLLVSVHTKKVSSSPLPFTLMKPRHSHE